MRPNTSALLLKTLLLVPLLLAACQSQPTSRMPRSFAAPVDSTKRLLSAFLSPTKLSSRISNIADRGTSMARSEVDFGTMGSTARTMAGLEFARVPNIAPSAKSLTVTELSRVNAIPKDPIWQRTHPDYWGARLRSSIDKTDEILWLHRRPLGEPDDYEHRTDPDDDGPEAGFVWRVLRRIFP